MNFSQAAASLIGRLGDGALFVHSDVFRTARLAPPVRGRSELLDSHISQLSRLAGGRALWMPAFNYDFPRTGVFDVRADRVQVGPIPEQFRNTIAEWRTLVPMFSVCGTGDEPLTAWSRQTDPFDGGSIFDQLVQGDGVVLYYGDTFSSNTLVHYSESLSGGPLYRYDKEFAGYVVTQNGERIDGSLKCHVRPLGRDLDYDWPRLERAAIEAGVCSVVEGTPEVLAASARELAGFWVEEMQRDPLSLLDPRSRSWVEPMLEKLGRRFDINDFEQDINVDRAG